MKNVLLALSCELLCEQTAQAIANTTRYRLAGVCGNSTEALELLIRLHPNVLIVDLSLPCEGGLGVLRAARAMTQPPLCLVLTNEVNEEISDALLCMGIQEVILQPCRVSVILRHLHELHEEAFAAQESVLTALRRLRVGPHYLGHRYLLEGIQRAMTDMSCLDGITKLLYPDIAAKYGSTARQVERNIRSAIDHAWECGGAEAMSKLFDYVPQNECPTNLEFIAVVADRLRQGYDPLM